MTRRANERDFDVESMLTYRISMLFSRLYGGTSRQLDGFGLAMREWRVLALLGRNEPMSASDLVARSPMDKASVSRAVAKLSADGLVATAPHPTDRRAQLLRLTPAGRRMYRRIGPRSIARQEALLAALTPAEQKDVYRILDKLQRRAGELLAERRNGNPKEAR